MPKGLPNNRILNYESDEVSSGGWTLAGKLNFARDFSLINRQHWEQTTRKGVPLVYRMAFTFSPSLTPFGDDGDYADIFKQDLNQIQIVAVKTAQQNWTMRNGTVKTHYARENMFKEQGISKKDRGAYDHTLHLTWSANPDTFLTPIDGDRANYTAGSWEYSKLIFPDDPSGSYIKVVSTHSDEETATAHSNLSIAQMYLSSRKTTDADSNAAGDADSPTKLSVLNQLMALGGHTATQDEVVDLARDNQDEPPYDLSESGNDTEPVESARVFLGITSGVQQTVVVDVPYGMCELAGVNAYMDNGENLTNGFHVRAEVLDIFPMEG